MGLIDTFKNKALQAGFDQLRDLVINPRISRYGTITSISFVDKTLTCRVQLLGLENEELEVSCSHIEIAADSSTITLSRFSANKPFLENVLNDYATRPIPIPESGVVRAGLSILKAIID